MANDLIAVPTTPKMSEHNGKWAAHFLMIRVFADGRVPYIAAECMSAPLFDSKFAASNAADRAAKHYIDTDGVFPNMCEPF